MGCSARVSQNSQASRATFSSGSWVCCSMYWWQTTRGGSDEAEGGGRENHTGFLWKAVCKIESNPHLDDAVHVRDEAVDAHFQQHDQSSAHVLPHFAVLVASQRKQTLGTKDARRGELTEANSVWHALQLAVTHSHIDRDLKRVPVNLFYIIVGLSQKCLNWEMGVVSDFLNPIEELHFLLSLSVFRLVFCAAAAMSPSFEYWFGGPLPWQRQKLRRWLSLTLKDNFLHCRYQIWHRGSKQPDKVIQYGQKYVQRKHKTQTDVITHSTSEKH